MDKKIKAGIIGATGYAGAELVRILLSHPGAVISKISSNSFEGQNINDIYPNFADIIQDKLCSADEVINGSDVIFAALPHGLCEDIAYKCAGQNKVFIDLGADFRLKSEEKYNEYYGLNYKYKDLHKNAVYGLCELNSEQIKQTKLVANPGCYPTGITLGLYPAVSEKLINTDNIIIDSKSGTTGAGRGLSQTTHFPDCNESFAPYKIGTHRHIPEIEQNISVIADKDIKVTFIPHLLPVNRGIESTIYCDLTKKIDLFKIYELHCDYYKDKKFVRVCPLGTIANIKNVRMSNYCDISLHLDEHTNKLIIVTAIDNMVKGAAGQAIQNMNLIFGLPEESGLEFIPPAF